MLFTFLMVLEIAFIYKCCMFTMHFNLAWISDGFYTISILQLHLAFLLLKLGAITST